MSENKNIAQEYIDIFNSHRSVLDDTCGEAVNKCREAAYEKFSNGGFPTKKDEDYKYTDISSFFEEDYGVDLFAKTATEENIGDFICDVPSIDAHTIYLINGWYYSGNEEFDLPKGVVVSSFAKASKEHPELFEKYYNKQAGESKDNTVHLNTMMVQDGLFCYVPKNTELDKPLQIINILSANVNLMGSQRSLFVLEENARAKVLICDHALSQTKFAANHVREIFAADNSGLEYYLLENQHNYVNQIISSFIHQGANSAVHSNVITLHNGQTRNNTFVTLAGEHAETSLSGMALTDKQQHVDNFTEIDHAVANCISRELFKNVLDDQSTGAFKGKVLVRKDAQKTAAYQTNKNICLTKEAYINTRPQLEIYADDVKCSHGATVGQLDDEALFYMKARGLSEADARLLLMFAFTHEVIEQIQMPALKDRIKVLVEGRLRGDNSKCEGCAMCS